MKKSSLFIFLLFSYPLLYSQVVEAPDSIKGGFIKCVIKEYVASNGIIDTLKIFKLTNAWYNSHGRKTKEENFIDNQLFNKQYFTYDKSGEILIADSTYRDFGFVYYDEYFYENDRLTLHERCRGKDSWNPNEAFAKWTNVYNKEGNLISEKYWTYDLSFNYDYTYTYNKEGYLAKLVSVGLYDYNNYQIQYEYNTSGKMIRLENLTADGKLISFDSLVYDISGRNTETFSFSKDKTLVNHITNKYDQQDRVTEYIKYIYEKQEVQSGNSSFSQKVDLKKTYAYDAFGMLTEETFSTDTGYIKYSKIKYGYDAHGNLVAMVCYDKVGEIASKTMYLFSK